MKKVIKIIDKIWSYQDGKKAHYILPRENEILRTILNSLAEGVIVADQGGKFIFFNPAAIKILGMGSQNVMSAEWALVYGCYYLDKTTPYPSDQLPLARAIRGEEVNNELIWIKNPERTEGVYINISASPLRDLRGSVNGGTVIFQNVTESKQMEESLKISEERVTVLFKRFPLPTYVWQHKGDDFILIDYNNAAEVLTQNSIKEFLGKNLSEMYANSSDIQADFLRCINEKITIIREMLYQFKNTGEIKDLMVSYLFIPPDLIMVHTEDCTERKKTEEELRKLSSAVEQTADSVVITNKEGVIEYVNPAFEETTGYSREEVLGQTPQVLKSGKHDRAFYEKLWKIILNGKPFKGTIINKKKNNELYWCEQTITPMKGRDGNITNFVSVIKDITELKERQEQEFRLRIAQELQQRLSMANISVPGFDIAGKTYSAVETSGDYFDFIQMPDGYIGMAIGDVCGHGIGAALIMAETRAYLRAFAKMESDPGVILTWLNQELVSDLDEFHFVTLILARIHPHKNLLDYAGAGHIPAYLLKSSGAVGCVMESKGVPLGFISNERYYKSEHIKLAPDDLVVFLTDGITEAQSLDETEFGVERAFEIINSHREVNACKIVEYLYKAVRAFSENQSQLDDITSIICKVNRINKAF